MKILGHPESKYVSTLSSYNRRPKSAVNNTANRLAEILEGKYPLLKDKSRDTHKKAKKNDENIKRKRKESCKQESKYYK